MYQPIEEPITPDCSIRCEIKSPSIQLAKDLSQIAMSCAIDLKLAFPILTVERALVCIRKSTIVLTLPFEIAVSSERAWKLASRIACFCPEARVSAQIAPLAAPAS